MVGATETHTSAENHRENGLTGSWHRHTPASAEGRIRSAENRPGNPHSGALLALHPPPPPRPGGSVARELVSFPALLCSPLHRVPPPSCKEEGAGGRGSQSRQRQRGEVAVTAAGRGREERRGGSALAPRSSPLCLRLCAHPLPKPAAPVPVPPGGPWTREIPWLLAPARTLRTPAPRARYAARGRRVSSLSRPPGAPSHGPGGDGRGAPGAMRGQSRKESLSDSRDLDGSYDQLTGESAWGLVGGGG